LIEQDRFDSPPAPGAVPATSLEFFYSP